MAKAKQEALKLEWGPDRVKALRERLGYTQTQLGEACGASLRTVQYWEEGRPMRGSALKILEVLERSAAQR